jgi:hypothetical protein
MGGTLPDLTEGQHARSGVSTKSLVWLPTQLIKAPQQLVRRRRATAVGTSGAVTFSEGFGFVAFRNWARTGLSRTMKFSVLISAASEQALTVGDQIRVTPRQTARRGRRRSPRRPELLALGGRFVAIGKRNIYSNTGWGSSRSGANLAFYGGPRVTRNARSSSSMRLPQSTRATYQDSEASASLSRRLFGRISGQFCSM